MNDGSTHLGTESLGPSGYLAPTLYRVKCQCDDCGAIYSYETTRLTKRDRVCPEPACIEARRTARTENERANFQKMIDEQRPPGHIGDKVVVKAIDATADIVMQDYGMTDLKDNIRHGDSMAPKLPGQQQAMADGFFGGGALKQAAGTTSRQAEMLKRRAIAGAFRGMAVNPSQLAPGAVAGQSPLRLVRTEKL